MGDRLNASVWRQDAYTLHKLQGAIERIIAEFRATNILPGTVVDLGAGDAPYKRLFASSGASYISCDIAEGPNVDVVLNANGIADQIASADARCVVSFQVLEHVWDLDAYLGECRRLLSPEGKLLLSTHGTWLYHPHPADFRRWTRDGLVREVQSRGFVVEKVVPLVGPLAWTSQFRCLAYSHVFGRLGLIGKFLAGISNVLFYTRMMIEDFVTPKALKESNAAVYVVIAEKAE